MKVRFIRAWQTYSKGQIITPTAALGETLILNKICEPVKETLKLRKKNAARNQN